MAKIKDNADEQLIAEKKRFLARQKPKPVLADRIKAREKNVEVNHQQNRFCSEEYN